MFLLEFEGKRLFKEFGIPIPNGVVFKVGETIDKSMLPPTPFVIKGQYLAGGRGKAGAVKIVRDINDFNKAVAEVSNVLIHGKRPSHILIESFFPHDKELYLSLLVSKRDKSIILLASREGGVEVEELAKKPGALLKLSIDPLVGIQQHQLRLVSKFLLGVFNKDLMNLIYNLYRLVVGRDLLLAEINPLAVDGEGRVVALDSKVIVDDNSEIRQDISKYYEYVSVMTEGEKKAKEYGFSYVPLEGEIGVIGNGAGLTMATLDLVAFYGGRPACFIDVGGGASEERIGAALDVLFSEIKPKYVFVNIFAGITRCDDVARAIVSVVEKRGISREKFVIRLTGTNEELGEEILSKAGFKVYKDMDEAAKKVVEYAVGGSS